MCQSKVEMSPFTEALDNYGRLLSEMPPAASFYQHGNGMVFENRPAWAPSLDAEQLNPPKMLQENDFNGVRGQLDLCNKSSKRVQCGDPIYPSFARPQPTNGSTIRTPAFTKSARFRVATARPWTSAVAAMRLSLIGMAFPVVRRRASSSAHFSPVSASQGRQLRTPTPASNQRSRAARFLPLGRMRIPNRSSPRMTGSTAISRSCADRK